MKSKLFYKPPLWYNGTKEVVFMGKRKRDIEEIKRIISETSDCTLLSTEYINVDSLLNFQCKCGNEFQTTFYKFEKRDKKQCNKCGFEKGQHKRLSYDEVKDFIENKSRSGCKLLSDTYKNAHEKMLLKCKCGRNFEVKWAHFRNSLQRQCKDCSLVIRAEKRRLPLQEVEEYIISKECRLLSDYKNLHSKLDIECECGKTFITSFAMFREYDINKCTSCRSEEKTTSKGEDKIREWLTSNNMNFSEQYTFEELKIERKLRFDFVIFNKNKKIKMLIEFDGKQHFGFGNFTDDTETMIIHFNNIQESDRIKNEFCFKNSIPLLRIPYNKYHKIEEILSNSLI